MEYKTLEELFIDKFEQLENENQKLREQLEENEKKDTLSDEDIIKISDHTGVFYVVDMQSYYNYNDILKNNGYNPELIESALSDEVFLEKFMNLQKKDSCWGSDKVGAIRTYTYQYLFKTTEHVGVLTYNPGSSDPFNMFNINDRTHFLDKERAEAEIKTRVLEQIKLYFERKCDEEFISESGS